MSKRTVSRERERSAKNGAAQTRQSSKNGGYSLIELIVTVLIMGMFSLIVLSFSDTSLTVYRIIGKEETLQTEAATAVSFITEVMESAENCGYSSTFTSNGHEGSCVWVKRPGDRYGFILYDKGARCLRYKEFTQAEFFPGGDLTVWDYEGKLADLFGDPYYLLADKVDNITFTSESVTNATGRLATIDIRMKFFPDDGEEDVYRTSFKVVNRNAAN